MRVGKVLFPLRRSPTISASDLETQSGDEHEPGNNMDSDVHLREGISDLRTLVDRTAEALVNAVDVVERPHVPRSAPRSVPRSSAERTAPPRSTHVQLDDDLGLLDPARDTER